MNKGELGFWQNDLRWGIKRVGDATRIESSSSIGVPDVHILVDGVCHWIELKHVGPLDKKVILRPSQKMWIKRCQRGGYFPTVLTKVEAREDRKRFFMGHRESIPLDDSSLESWLFSAQIVWFQNIDFGELKEFINAI